MKIDSFTSKNKVCKIIILITSDKEKNNQEPCQKINIQRSKIYQSFKILNKIKIP